MTHPENIQAVQAKQLKNGKYEYTAILEDGSREILKKSGSLKPIVNIYPFVANNSVNYGLGSYCTYNTKVVLRNFWGEEKALKSINVTVV